MQYEYKKIKVRPNSWLVIGQRKTKKKCNGRKYAVYIGKVIIRFEGGGESEDISVDRKARLCHIRGLAHQMKKVHDVLQATENLENF